MALIVGGIAAIGYSDIYAPTPSSAAIIKANAATSITPAQPIEEPSSSISVGYQSEVFPAPPEATVDQWLADALGPDPDKRRIAIAAMANAQSEQVVPTLEKLLIHGEPQVDRPLALSSLRALALVQGDIDGGIRNALRQAVYDGSDDAITVGAQAALEEVESFFDHGVTEPSRH